VPHAWGMQCYCLYKHFSAERKYWTLFRNTCASIWDKIQQGIISKVGNFFSIILYQLTCWISRIQYSGSFALEPLATTCRLWIWRQTLCNQKTRVLLWFHYNLYAIFNSNNLMIYLFWSLTKTIIMILWLL
jgi:hypothetical protein